MVEEKSQLESPKNPLINDSDERLINLMASAIEKVIDKKFPTLKKSAVNDDIPTKNVIEHFNIISNGSSDNESNSKKKESKIEDNQKKEKDEKSDKKPKPEQKKVSFSYKINCISDVSEVSCTFEVDIKVFTNWKDEKLIGRKKGSYINYEKEKGLFDPDLIVTNEQKLEEIEKDCNTKIVNSEEGEVKRTSHYRGRVYLGAMNLKLFPFDCQNLQICFKPYKLPEDECVLVPKLDECAMDRRIMHEWDILGDCIKIFSTDPETSSTKKVYSTLFVTVLASRKYNWHLTNVYMPTLAFLVVSWLVFLYGVEDRAERIDISIATLLASISNKFVIEGRLPKVGYRTSLDTYLDFCFYLQMLTMLSTVVVYSYKDTPFFAKSLNNAIFALEFLSTIIFFDWMYVNLFNHQINMKHWVESSKLLDEESSLYFDRTHEAACTPRIDRTGLIESFKKHVLLRRESSIMKIMRVVSNNPEQHIDDGSLLSAVSSDDHFIHFGVQQISKKVMNSINTQLLDSLDKAKMKEEQTMLHKKEIIETFQLGARRTNFVRHHSQTPEENQSNLTDSHGSTSIIEKRFQEEDAAAKLLQSVFRRRFAARKRKAVRVKIEQVSKEDSVKKIWRWYRRMRAIHEQNAISNCE